MIMIEELDDFVGDSKNGIIDGRILSETKLAKAFFEVFFFNNFKKIKKGNGVVGNCAFHVSTI